MEYHTPKTNPTIRIHPDQFAKLELLEAKTHKLMKVCGFGKKDIARRIHLNLHSVVERRSSVSPYEALRATHILQKSTRQAGLEESDGVVFTVALLSHRRKSLVNYAPDDAFRKWRRSLKRLSDRGFAPIGICVLEINQISLKGGRIFYEPHLHGVVWGARVDEVQKAFAVRKLAKGEARNRPTHFQALDDLDGQIGYMTKFVPEYRLEPDTPRLDGRWHRGKLAGRDAGEWLEFMSRYRVSELIKFRGIDDGNLDVDGISELAPMPELSSKGPKSGRKRPSGPRGRR